MSRMGKGLLVATFLLGVSVAWRRRRRHGEGPESAKGLRLAYVSRAVHRSAGPAGYLAELVERFAREHQVTVFSPQLDADIRPWVRHHRVPAFLGSWLAGFPSFIVANSLLIWWQRFLGEDFDIIHSNGLDSPFLADVLTCHFCEGAGLKLEERGLGRLPTETWPQKLRSWDYHWYRHLAAWVERLVVSRRRRRLIAVSARTRDDLVECYGDDASGVVAIPNGVNLARFHPRNRSRFRDEVRRESGLRPEAIMLLFVGSFDWERKGLPQLLAALALLEDEMVHLVVVGQGEVAHYAALAQSLEVASRVSFAGPSPQVERYYAAADIFVFPTLYEPFGLVIVEAMASGLPVLTSRRAGAADCIISGESGLLLDDPTDPREIAAKLTLLVGQPELRQRLGPAAHEAVKDQSWDEVARRVLEVYHQVMVEKRAVAEHGLRPQSGEGWSAPVMPGHA